MGLPNGTAIGQVMDDMFQTFKAFCRTNTQDIYNELVFERMTKIRRRNAGEDVGEIPTVVSLKQNNISRIVNGLPEDDITSKPFDRSFTPERIKKSWAKIGLCPFTKNALKSNKLKHEVGQRKDEMGDKVQQKITDLSESYEKKKIDVAKDGFNHEVFDMTLPQAFKVCCKKEEKDQEEALIKNGATFSASGIFIHTGSMLLNSKVVIAASKKVLENMQSTATTKKNDQVQKDQDDMKTTIETYQKFKAEGAAVLNKPH